jgi:alkylhydroperoxidase family enzyme
MIDALRIAAQPGRPAPPGLAAYLEKVRVRAYKITDRDIDELKALGFSEDEIFEHTVSAAVATGLERLDAALSVLP